jgi:predicted NUDIX family NTP pyrophosphohydrolase
MMIKSCGICAWRRKNDGIEVLLVHPTKPLGKTKEYHCWSFPKGRMETGETRIETAMREFCEETGFTSPKTVSYLSARQTSKNKEVTIYHGQADYDVSQSFSNESYYEYPKGSNQYVLMPENDRAQWFDVPEALNRITYGQRKFLSDLTSAIDIS